MCKVSVIIPVYNVEDYIQATVNSIQVGTFSDFELLLIDDGSTDGTLALCQQMAEEDFRIHVYTKENGGVGSARNYGLDRARGDYIAFIDGDDLVTEDYLEKLVSFTDDNKLDWVSCGFWRYYPGEPEKKRNRKMTFAFKENVVLRGEKARLMAKRAIFSSPTGMDLPSNCIGLFRRSVIEKCGLRVPEDIIYGEDRVFNYLFANHLEGFGYLMDRLYRIVIRPTSAQQTMLKNDIVDQLSILVEAIHRKVASEEGIWPDEALRFVWNHATNLFCGHIFPGGDIDVRRERWEKFDQAISQEPFSLVWNQLRIKHTGRSLRRRLFYPFLKRKKYELIERSWRPLTIYILRYRL